MKMHLQIKICVKYLDEPIDWSNVSVRSVLIWVKINPIHHCVRAYIDVHTVMQCTSVLIDSTLLSSAAILASVSDLGNSPSL